MRQAVSRTQMWVRARLDDLPSVMERGANGGTEKIKGIRAVSTFDDDDDDGVNCHTARTDDLFIVVKVALVSATLLD